MTRATEAHWANVESISTPTDSDYLQVVCAAGLLTGVGIDYLPSSGDLDIEVYESNQGRLLGISQGINGNEYVPLSLFGYQAVIMRVYGYRQSQGLYGVNLFCQ